MDKFELHTPQSLCDSSPILGEQQVSISKQSGSSAKLAEGDHVSGGGVC